MSGLIAENSPTGGTASFSTTFGTIGYRKMNEPQEARSRHYQVRFVGTWDEIRLPEGERTLGFVDRGTSRKKKVAASTAKREHVARLLRKCQSITEQLITCEDRLAMATLGADLCANLEELWRHRLVREDDWIEVLNLMQIVLRGENFEQMTNAQKRSLAEIFNAGLTIRTIGSIEARRAFRILKDAGFDVWRGVGPVSE